MWCNFDCRCGYVCLTEEVVQKERENEANQFNKLIIKNTYN